MRNLFIIFLLILTVPCYADDDDAPKIPSKPIEYSEVVKVEGFTKDKLYSSALAWFGRTFRQAQKVIDVQDKEAGRIIGKGSFQYEPSSFIASAAIRGWGRTNSRVTRGHLGSLKRQA